MAITKIQSESLNLADDFAFTGTITGAGESNKPYFSATAQTTTGLSSDTYYKITFNNEIVDSDNCFDTSTYRFTPNVAGYYLFYFKMLFYAQPGTDGMKGAIISFRKNGSGVGSDNNGIVRNGGGLFYFTQPQITNVYYMNGTTDYMEAWGNCISDNQVNYDGNGCFFTAYKL